MSIGDFSKVVRSRISDTINANTDKLRNKLQQSSVNELHIDKASIGYLIDKLSTGPLSDKKEVADEVARRARAVNRYLNQDDWPQLESRFGIKLTPDPRDGTLINFRNIDAIRDYIFVGEVGGKKFDLRPYIHKGHIAGVVTEQFFSAADAARSGTLSADEEAQKKLGNLLPKLFELVGEYLLKKDLASSNLPDRKVTARRKVVRNRQQITAMQVEFQVGSENEESGRQAGIDKRRFLAAYKKLFTDEGVGDLNKGRQLEYLSRLVMDNGEGEYSGYMQELADARAELLRLTENPKLIDDLINVRGSPSYKDVVISKILKAIKANEAKGLTLSEYSVELRREIKADKYLQDYRKQLKDQHAQIEKYKKAAQKAADKLKKDDEYLFKQLKLIEQEETRRLRNLKGQYLNVVKLKTLINSKLRAAVTENMKRPNLIYRSGRFAGSVNLLDISYREGRLQAFYTYMKYPYQTFEPGFVQGRKGYDPRRLIERSIRDVAITLTKEKFGMTRV